MFGAASPDRDTALFDKEEGRYRDAVVLVGSPIPVAWVIQERSESTSVFTNTFDTDPALLNNQRWVDSIRKPLPASDLSSGTVTRSTLKTVKALDRVLETVVAAGKR